MASDPVFCERCWRKRTSWSVKAGHVITPGWLHLSGRPRALAVCGRCFYRLRALAGVRDEEGAVVVRALGKGLAALVLGILALVAPVAVMFVMVWAVVLVARLF